MHSNIMSDNTHRQFPSRTNPLPSFLHPRQFPFYYFFILAKLIFGMAKDGEEFSGVAKMTGEECPRGELSEYQVIMADGLKVGVIW